MRQLSLGVFSNLSLGMEGKGTIDPEREEMVIHHVNQALRVLHMRFELVVENVFINTFANMTLYPLRPQNSYMNSYKVKGCKPFIQDPYGCPWEGRVIKILEVYDRFGVELPLNDKDKRLSVFTPQPDVLEIPMPWAGQNFSVTYQGLHRELVPGDMSQEINISAIMEPALMAYTAYGIYANMNTQEALVRSQEQMALYLSLVQQIESEDLASQSSANVGNRFQDKGFI